MNEEQFKVFFETNVRGLYTYACALLKNGEEAKDIMQAAFIKVWERRQQLDGPGGAKALAYKITYRLGLNAIRDAKIHDRHHVNIRHNLVDRISYPVEEKELQLRMTAAINELPERCREVFINVRIRGMKYKEVATLMGISDKTVESQMAKAMNQLKESLGDPLLWLLIILMEISNRLIV